jgi:peptide/nickel transport system substrate-binding protein
LTIAARQELLSFANFTGLGSANGGNQTIRLIAHDYLTVQDDARAWRPHLATELPSVERGTWRLNADGTMDVTWKIRPGVKWHDGAPFTSDDLAFAFTLHRDPGFTLTSGAAQVRLMDSVTTPDPFTLAVHWSSPSVDAIQAPGLDPMPKHLLEGLYQSDKDALINSPLLLTEFVGLGPYRIASWESGVELQFERFDGFYLGRPPLDRVVVKYVKDPNTQIANILAGSVDVVIPPSVDLETASEIRRRWEGTGSQVFAVVTDRLRFLRPQYRPEFARPQNGLTNLTVRRALYHAVDRAALAEVVGQGLAPAADSWFAPSEAIRAQVESAIPQYPFDPARAQQLLTQAGWVRGSDGILVNQQTGQRFEAEISVRPTTGSDKDSVIIADGWKAVGAQIGIYNMPAALADDRKHLSEQPFVTVSSLSAVNFYDGSITHSREISSDANRWTGRNNQGYSNPTVDALQDKLLVTLDERERVALHRQLLQEGMGDVLVLPLYWQTDPVFALRGVQGIKGANNWNMFEWDKTS